MLPLAFDADDRDDVLRGEHGHRCDDTDAQERLRQGRAIVGIVGHECTLQFYDTGGNTACDEAM